MSKKRSIDKKENKEMAYMIKTRLAREKNDYIRNIINARYFIARCNMIAEQLNSGKILETIDSCQKTIEYMRAEYALVKMQAIMSMRNAHFAKQSLLSTKEFNFTEKDILALEDDYYNGKIIREDYDDEYKKRNKAEFVASE